MVEVVPYQALEANQMVEIQEAELKDSWPQEVGLVRVLTVFYKIFKPWDEVKLIEKNGA